MSKTISLRLDDATYRQFVAFAAADNRTIANLIETLALRQLAAAQFTDEFETRELAANRPLRARLKRGHRDAAARKGTFVD